MKLVRIIYPIALLIATIAIMSQHTDLPLIKLKALKEIDLSTLLVSFPIILALVERFNELFVVKRDADPLNPLAASAERKTNSRFTMYASLTIGILLSVAGFRILETFMYTPSSEIQDIASGVVNTAKSEVKEFQKIVFKVVDAVLTAAVIAGGSDGWHQLVKIAQTTVSKKNDELKQLLKSQNN